MATTRRIKTSSIPTAVWVHIPAEGKYMAHSAFCKVLDRYTDTPKVMLPTGQLLPVDAHELIRCSTMREDLQA